MPRPPSASYKARDRGSLEFESKLHEEEGQIMKIARQEIATVPPSLPIKDASELMVKKEIRRLPVVSPGKEKLQGIIVSRDIVDFLGGGEKHQIIKNKHKGNFLSAINDSSKMIMNSDVPHANTKSSISEVAKMLIDEKVGGAPIVDKEERVIGIVTERDFAKYIPSPAKTRVGPHMVGNVVTAPPELYLIDAMKKMIDEGFRRLPVVEDGKLLGIITSVDVLEYFGTNEVFNHMATNDASDAMSIEISEIMTKNPITATPQEDLGEVARRMENHGYGGLPVLEGNKLVGIITERDMLNLLV